MIWDGLGTLRYSPPQPQPSAVNWGENISLDFSLSFFVVVQIFATLQKIY